MEVRKKKFANIYRTPFHIAHWTAQHPVGEDDILVIYFTKVPSELCFRIVINNPTSETVVITSDTSLIPWELAQICQAGSEVPSANIYQDELPKRVVIITYWDKRDIFLKNVLITIQLKILVETYP